MLARRWLAAHRDRARESQIASDRRNPERTLWQAVKYRAKSTGIEFSLELKDIIFPPHCPIFGTPLVVNYGKGFRNGNAPSLDRIDSSKGYTKENTRIISDRANRIKNDGTIAEHRAIADWMEREGA